MKKKSSMMQFKMKCAQSNRINDYIISLNGDFTSIWLLHFGNNATHTAIFSASYISCLPSRPILIVCTETVTIVPSKILLPCIFNGKTSRDKGIITVSVQTTNNFDI